MYKRPRYETQIRESGANADRVTRRSQQSSLIIVRSKEMGLADGEVVYAKQAFVTQSSG